ncbi:unnamed protein product, partial [Polarella glacialis]
VHPLPSNGPQLLYGSLLPAMNRRPLAANFGHEPPGWVEFRPTPVAGDGSFVLCLLRAVSFCLRALGSPVESAAWSSVVIRRFVAEAVNEALVAPLGRAPGVGELAVASSAAVSLARTSAEHVDRFGQTGREGELQGLQSLVAKLQANTASLAAAERDARSVQPPVCEPEVVAGPRSVRELRFGGFERLLAVDVEPLKGEVDPPRILISVPTSEMPLAVRDPFEASDCCRLANHLLTLLANQAEHLPQSALARFSLIARLMTQLLPMPLPVHHPHKAARCFWMQEMKQETKADLMRHLYLIARHFAAVCFTLRAPLLQFLYEAFRIGTAAHVYRMKGGAFTVQSIEPHVVRKKGGKEYEGWNTSSPILSSLMAEQAAKGKNITLAPAWAQRVTLAPNTPDVYVSVLYIAELDQYYYYMFEAKPLPELLAQGGQRLAAIEDFLPSPPEWPRGVTLIVMAHKRDRLHGLLATVNRYCQSSPDLLHEVVMIWNNQTDPETVELMRQNTSGGAVPVRVLETDANSMNNRFAVWGALQTEGAIVQDDDMWVSSDSLQLLVDAWRQQPDRLFGAANENATDKLTNGESWENNSYQWKEVNPKCYSQSSPDIPSDIPSDVPYCVFEARDYSILLPHPWVLSRRYLKEYMLNPEGTKLVDDMMNCDDIYLNSVVSNATRAAPIALDIPVHRFPEWANGDAMWVSQGKKWLEKRSRCLEKVNSMYAGEPVSEETGTVWRRNFSGLVPWLCFRRFFTGLLVVLLLFVVVCSFVF